MPLTRALVLLLVLPLVPACREAPPPQTDAPKTEASSRPPPKAEASTSPLAAARAAAKLERVEVASHVCMVNDQYMGREQIPVSVEGRTYYGCCASCKDKLQNSAAARTAKDPVTGRVVDKASAVLAKNEAGKMLYFESEQTFATYLR